MYVRCRSSIESSLSIVIKLVECDESTPSVLTERFMNLTLNNFVHITTHEPIHYIL